MKYFSQQTTMQNYGKLYRFLMIAMMVMLTSGMAWADNWPNAYTTVTTWNTTKTYYLYSSNEQVGSTGTYKFYVLDTEEDPSSYDFTNATKYDAISPVKIDGGRNDLAEGSGIHVTIVFNTSKPVGFVGFFCINDGTLEMNLGQYYTNTDGITLKRTGGHSTYSNSNYNCPFTIPDNSSGGNGISFSYNNNEKNLDAQKIIITGNNPSANELVTYPNSGYTPTVATDTATFLPNRQFVIDGGCVPTLTETGSGSTAGYNINYNGTQGKTTFFRVMCGTLQLTNVTLQNCSASNGNAGAIYVITNNSGFERKSSVKVDLEHCWIHHCANGYPGIYIQYGIAKYTGTAATPPTVTINRSKFSDCYATFANKNAAIRSYSNGLCNLTMNKCTVWNNYGGGVRWQSTRPCTAIFNNCLIKKNKAYGNPSSSDAAQGSGGGLLIKSSATINGCLVRDNWAQVSGGGIYYTAFEENVGNTEYEPEHGLLTFDMDPDLGTTVIEENEAVNHGGGIAVMAQRMRAYPYYYGYTNGNPTGQYTMTFSLHGAIVRDNTASTGNGGGVYISRAADASFYKTTCNLDYGNIYNNKALNGYGGGVCVQSLIGDPGETPSGIYPKDIIVTTGVNGGSNSMQVYDNDAQKGAGIYVEAYPVTYNGTTSKVTTTLYNGTDINNNSATTNGGGLYVEQGLVTIAGSGTTNHPYIHENQTGTNGNGGGVYLNNGNIEMSLATIGGVDNSDPQNPVGLGNTAGSSGGGVYVNTGTVNMLSTSVLYNKANALDGGGIFVNNGNVNINHNESGTTSPSNISHNIAERHGGGIYDNIGRVLAYGSFNGDTDYPVQITYNEAETGSGGGIFCYGNGAISEYDIRLRRVNVSNNKALGSAQLNSPIDLGCGGGIYLQEGKISVINGTIDSNTANVGGGGIYTHSGNIDINPTQDERNASKITNNIAGLNGGGLNTHQGYIRIFGNSAANDDRIKITGNEATTGSGGGIFCFGGALSDEYIIVLHADLVGNKALNGGGTQTVLGDEVVSGCGGGMYLQKGKIHVTDVKIQSNTAKLNGGGINNHSGNIDVDGCLIGGEGAGNSANRSGGGIYTNLGDIDIKDYTETSGNITRIETKITHNTAVENGGGADTHSGTIWVNKDQQDDQIEISHNTAKRGGGLYANAGTIVAYNANINNNTATVNGGGINNHSGNIMIYGGTLSNNHANTGHGGGAYTNVGDIDIYPFPENSTDLRQGTMIFNNLALKNGGAFNNHTGRVDARYATLFNNTASQGNGGGIYCEGPHTDATGFTIRLLGSQLVQNKTRGQDGTAAEPTGRGGGIYLKYGDIYAHDTWIYNNSANRHGGGINNHEGTILVYGCNIENNTAVEGKGGGIYANEGQIHTGPCFNGTVSQSTVIKNNVANENGGGINNHKGNITINGDYIAYNEAVKGDGGGVYIANGIINMFGGTIANNKADQGKGGGVYSGGGQYNIQKREDNPKPVVTILDADISRDGDNLVATIHYHVVDKGNNNGTSPAHGFYWGTSVPETPTGTPNYTYSQGNSQQSNISYTGSVCDGSASGYKVVIRSGITAGQTYEVKAFYSYGAAGETVYGFSEKATFTAYSAAPTVVTGSVTNLVRMDGSTTQYQVEVNGKVHDRGTSGLTAKGIEWMPLGGTYTPVAAPQSELALDFFTITLKHLSPATKYIVRAYATNNGGTAYGDTVSFWTPRDLPNMGTKDVVVSNVTSNSATFSFTMPNGTQFGASPKITSYGFVWSTDDDPELKPGHTIPVTSYTDSTFSISTTAAELTLQPSTTYYVRAFASKSVDEPAAYDINNYSITTPVQFITKSDDGKPVVRATRITDITQHAANIHGKLVDAGSSAITGYGIVWSLTNTEPEIGAEGVTNVSVSGAPSEADFIVAMPGLNPNTTYYVRTYATNSVGTAYSNNYNFTALPVALPHALVTSIENIQKTSADIVCQVSDGGANITDWGVKYSTNSDMSGASNIIKPGGTLSGNTFTANLTDLTKHTLYYVQAYVTNSAGTHTCQTVTFTTDYDKPTVDELAVASVTFNVSGNDGEKNASTINYKVTPFTETTVKTHGVTWSTFHNPTRSDSDVANTHFKETTGASISDETHCNQTRYQKYPNTKYYVRAYASTEDPVGDDLPNIVYSEEISFISLPAISTGESNTITNLTNNSATLQGTIVSRDTEGNLVNNIRGVCWSTSQNPTRTGTNYAEETITATSSTPVSFAINATGLSVNTPYYYRAYYYRNSDNAIAYGEEQSFTTREYSVDLSAYPAEAGTVSGSYESLENNSYKATATANAGYTFANWTEGTNIVSADVEYTFNVTENKTLVANFTPKQYTITTTANPSTGGTTAGGGTVTYNTTVTLTATPSEGYQFVSWALNGEEVSTDATYTFTYNIAGNATFVANFELVSGRGSSQSNHRPRDIYPAPAREPWDWDDDEWAETVCTPSPKQDSTNNTLPDSIAMLIKQRQNRDVIQPSTNPSVDHNSANEGGGIYIANGGKILFSSGSINLNEAHVNGGGIYLEQGSIMHMKNICEVNGNHTPDFSLTEDANGNPVIVGGGAGIYLDGKLYLGNKIDDAKGTHRLIVDKNYAMTAFTETAYTNGDYNNSYYLRNNVFLPYTTNKQAESYFNAYSDYTDNASATTPDNSKTRVIALLSDISNEGNTNYSHIGFSVTKGKIPVIATAKKEDQDTDDFRFEEYGIYNYDNDQHNTEEWMNTITGRMNSTDAANASIFDDARAYIAIHARQDDDPFRNDFIYLWDCWTTPIVKYDPAHYDMYGHELAQQDDSHYTIDANGLWHIKDEKGLAWFSANVNRLNGTKGSYNDDSYASLNAVLEADLDMTEYLWVPIGSVRQVDDNINTIFRDIDNTTNTDKLGYRGTFNGQGHVIKGIDCRYISSLVKYGLFGNLEEGANVYNTFVDASSFRTNDNNTTYHVGGIAGLVEEGATISNSEARATIDVTLAKKATSYVGGLVGKAEGTTEHPTLIHSSMAMPEIKGTVDYMGGLVGQLGVSGSAKCDLFNSFANPKFPENATTHHPMSSNKYIGGLVGENNGTVENCYSRLQGDEPTSDGTNNVFGWFAGTNNATINYCYAPRVANESGYDYTTFKYKREGTGTITDPDNYGTTLRYSGKYGFKHRDHQMKKGTTRYEQAVESGKAGANDTLVGGLQFTLNRWVNAKNTTTNTYSTWTRTMASPINDDYPVLMLTKKNDSENFNSVGSIDSIYMLYTANVNTMITSFNAVDAEKHPTPSIYLYNTNPDMLNVTNNDNVMLAINEDIGILQSVPLKARAGVTIKNARKGNNDFTTDPNWHLFSSAIQNVPMGLDYHTDTTYTNGYVYNSPAGYGGQQYSQDIPNKDEHSQSVYSNRNYFDPPQTTWFQSDNNSALSYNASRNKIGYFPTNTPYGTWRPGFAGGHSSSAEDGFFDLYCYSEEFYHWINFKREGSSEWKDHWHMDPDDNSDHWRLDYGYDVPTSSTTSTFNLGNEPYLLTGKGYMMALSSESMMMADGLLNTGDIYAPVTLTDVGIHSPRPWRRYDEPWRTLNMIGNPYQSYLDFYEFVFNTEANNKNLLYNVNGDYCYALRDDKNKENPYVYYTTHQSDNPEYSASRFIHPHQGFFVKVKGSGNIKFNNAMRSSIGYGSTFREEHLNYPLVNLLCFDSEGKRDLTTVELKRPEQGGGLKMTNLNATDGLIGAYMDGNLYQTLFTPEGISTIPIHFKAMEDGFFTLHWNTLHGDFSYLHLIDNLTGADVDCLTTDEYKFEGKVSDYNSRFKLVFDCTGIDEPEAPDPDDGPTVFAFQMGDELIVNGEGTLQLFDLNGRCLMTRQAVGQQSSVSLPQVAAGMYLLRLTSNKQVRVQKMVIK